MQARAADASAARWCSGNSGRMIGIAGISDIGAVTEIFSECESQTFKICHAICLRRQL
jgi:hypothetical protein